MKLRYFSDEELRGWKPNLDPVLLRLLDLFRHHWSRPVQISPAPGAIGRQLGKFSTSQHNLDYWGQVRAIDVMPAEMRDVESMQLAIRIAINCGFTGIGVYPDWKPAPGLHLDVRRDRVVGQPARWGAVLKDGQQVYVTQDEALRHAAERARQAP